MVEPLVVDSYDFDGGRVVALRGELDASTCRGLAERLSAPSGSLIVVDLRELTFLDSSGLSLFAVARRAAIENGGNLVVSNPALMVERVLQITGLDSWVADWDPAWSNDSRSGSTP